MASMPGGGGSQAATELVKTYEEGKKYLRERELKKACRLFTRAITAYDPQVDIQDDLAVVYCARSQANFGLKKMRDSLLDAEESARLRPHWSKGHFRRAEVLAEEHATYAAALESYRLARSHQERDSRSLDILDLRILRLEDRLDIESSDLILEQLSPGRDICLSTFNPIKRLVYEFARGMQNIVYIVGDRRSKECIVVDACWDVDGILEVVERKGWRPIACIVTHNHFDHYGGKPPAPFGNFGITVQGVKTILNKHTSIPVYIHANDADAFQNDSSIDPARIVGTSDNQIIWVGGEGRGRKIQFLHTPGHTPGAQCIRIDGARILTGDTLFVNSCGRMDLPGGCPTAMFNTLQNKLATLPPSTKLYPGHSYGGYYVTTVGRERRLGVLRPGDLESWLRMVTGSSRTSTSSNSPGSACDSCAH